MATLDLIRNTAQSIDSNFDVISRSKEACECMDLEKIIEQALQLFSWVNEHDLRAVREVYTGKVAAEKFAGAEFVALFTLLELLHTHGIKLGKYYEGRGHEVAGLSQLRQIRMTDFGIYAILKEASGKPDVPASRNIEYILNEIRERKSA